MKELKLQLSIAEANTIIKALGNLPYTQVHELIAKIHSQATAQLTAENGNGTSMENGKINSETVVN
ncbi:MAG: hypothetical protein IAF38_07880 [Bacteroidia bacterium]|nr:hypothetical protein [Bacteroidia bacterium]